MNAQPPPAKKDFNKDLKTFEQLPAKTKELELLRDQAEKAIGPEEVEFTKKIADKSK